MRTAVVLALAFALLPAAPARAQQLTYQQDATHSGQATVPGLDPPFRRRWVASFGQPMSYPVIAGGRVFVTVRNPSEGPYGTRVVALSATTGGVLWERPFAHRYYWMGLAFTHGSLFALDGDARLHSLDPATGAVRWTKQLPGDHADSEPTPAGDSLYVHSSGGVTKVDPLTGDFRWSTASDAGSHTSPTVVDGRVFISSGCAETLAFDAGTGRQLWRFYEHCAGGGGKTVAHWGGRLYVRDAFAAPPVLDAASGAKVGEYPPSSMLPAFSGDTGYFGSSREGDLLALAMPGLQKRWSRPGIMAPPLIVNGRVIAGMKDGVVALDAGSGQLLWRDPDVVASPPDEHNVSSPVAGLGAGDGIFAVPTEAGLLVAYEHGSGAGAPVPGVSGQQPTVPGAPPPAANSSPTIEMVLKRRQVYQGERTRLLGRLSGTGVLGRRRVRLQFDEHPYDGRWVTAARGRTLADGTFGFLVAPKRNTLVRVVLADDPAVAAAPQELFAEFPFRFRENRRAGTVTLTIFAFRGAQIRRRPSYAYWSTGRTRPWRRVARTRWKVATRRYVRTTVRFPRGLLRRRGAHWVICQPEPVADGIGRPSEFERRCGEPTLPRGLN